MTAASPPPPAAAAREDGHRPSLGELLSDVSQDLTALIRQEADLAKAEIKQSATRAGKGAGMLGGATVAGHFVLLFLSIALWWALGETLGRGWSALIVAALWLVVAAVLALVGRKELRSIGGVPQTAATVKKIPEAIKGNETSS
jgi:hypothetical protein